MLDARFRRDAPLSPLRASGALSLLSPWKVRGVGIGDARPIAERSAEIAQAVARALAARPGLTAADVDAQIEAAIAALPPGLTEADVQAAVSTSVAGRAVTLAQVATWTAPSRQAAFMLRSTGIDVPTAPVLLIGRLGAHIGTAYLSVEALAAIPRNDGGTIVGGTKYYLLPVGSSRGLYLAQTARHRLKVGGTTAGRPVITFYRLVLAGAS